MFSFYTFFHFVSCFLLTVSVGNGCFIFIRINKEFDTNMCWFFLSAYVGCYSICVVQHFNTFKHFTGDIRGLYSIEYIIVIYLSFLLYMMVKDRYG